MELVVDVKTAGLIQQVEVDLVLTDPRDVARVIDLCGADDLARLAKGEWVLSAAQAILYVNLIRVLVGDSDWVDPPFTFDRVDLDWGELSAFMGELDLDMESALSELMEKE